METRYSAKGWMQVKVERGGANEEWGQRVAYGGPCNIRAVMQLT